MYTAARARFRSGHLRPAIAVFLLNLSMLANATTLYAASAEREVFDADSPQLLRAVGKLSVPGYDQVDGRRRFREENCSASLVAPSTILTAWHCLEHYTDLSRDPQFSLLHGSDAVTVAATRLADGGSMEADWALLRLARPIRSVGPLPVDSVDMAAGVRVLLAGYARDQGLGEGGERLTWQAGCRLTEQKPGRVGTDCVTYKGASGGPVLLDGRVVGVISAGDSEQRTYFAPSTRFISPFRLHAR